MKLWLSLLLLPVVTGCVIRLGHHSNYQASTTTSAGSQWPPEHKMLFEYHVRNGHATLESKQVVLVIHGLTSKQCQLFHFQGSRQAVQIAGNGTSTVSVTCTANRQTVAFRSSYGNGTNTLEFGPQTVRFTEGGRYLLAHDRTFDLGEGRKIVHLRGDQARVE